MTIRNSIRFGMLLSGILFFFQLSKAQTIKNDSCPSINSWGVGIRLQNSGRITVKKYLGDKAFELIVGRPGYWRKHIADPDGYDVYYTDLHARYRPWSIQLNMIRHKNTDVFPGLKWYYGLGGQMVTGSYTDSYWYYDGTGQPQYRSRRYSEFGIGANAGIGLEYTFCSIPFSAFMDDFIYAEAFRHPLFMKNQFGMGLRYNF